MPLRYSLSPNPPLQEGNPLKAVRRAIVNPETQTRRQTPNPKPLSLNPKSQTPISSPKPQTPNSKPEP